MLNPGKASVHRTGKQRYAPCESKTSDVSRHLRLLVVDVQWPGGNRAGSFII